MSKGMVVHIWFALTLPRSWKLTAFIDKPVEKKVMWSKHGGFEILS